MVTRRTIGVVGQAVNVTRRCAARIVQLGRRPVVAVPVLVLAVRVLLGVWPAAVAGAVAGTVGLLFGLAAWDRRQVAGRARPVERGSRVDVVEVVQACAGPAGSGAHVEFARGLAGLADWYLSECERETQR